MELIFIRIRINISIRICIRISIRIRSSRETLQLFLTAVFFLFCPSEARTKKKRRAHFARPPLRSAREGEIDRFAVKLD